MALLERTKRFLLDIYDKRDILKELSRRDFQKQYMGSYLGIVWVYLQPLLFVSVLYFIFTAGLKGGGQVGGAPFIIYLLSGMVAWFYLAENFNTLTGVIMQHSFLLKKVDFRLSLLPLVKLASSSVPHLFLVIVTIVLAAYNGLYPGWYLLQIVYYFVAMALLLLGLGWLTSSTRLFIPDVTKLVGLLVTFGFWLTPIFWDIDRLPEHYRWIIKLNPAVYIVQGYRDAIYGRTWFWEHPYETLYYWSFTIVVLLAGITVFKRLKPHFAEVV